MIVWLMIPIIVLAIILTIFIKLRYIDKSLIFLIIMFTPTVKIWLSWLTKSDPYLFIFFSVILFIPFLAYFRIVRFVSSFLAIFCHAHIGLIAILGLCATRYMTYRRLDMSSLFGAIFGIVVFRTTITTLFPSYAGRNAVVYNKWHEMMFSGGSEIFSFFAVSFLFQFVVFVVAGIKLIGDDRVRVKNAIDLLCIVIAFVIPFVISCLFTADHTRVFVLSTLPSFVIIFIRYNDLLSSFFRGNKATAIIISMIMLGLPQFEPDGWRGYSPMVVERLARKLAPKSAQIRQCVRECKPQLE